MSNIILHKYVHHVLLPVHVLVNFVPSYVEPKKKIPILPMVGNIGRLIIKQMTH